MASLSFASASAQRVLLNHRTTYRYGHPVAVGTQTVRLRPSGTARAPVQCYSLKIEPEEQFLIWRKDSDGNNLAQVTLSEKTSRLDLQVSLVVDLSPYNPFEFSLEPWAQEWPLVYQAHELHNVERCLLADVDSGPVTNFLNGLDRRRQASFSLLEGLNRLVYSSLQYETRLEPGVRSPAETLRLGRGSCRDSAWLLVQASRLLGLAARFVSGYLVELAPEPAQDSLALHAWAEVYLPGAGWVGLDGTSGLFTAEGHIPLAWSPQPEGAAPIEGLVEKSDSTLEFEMGVTRLGGQV